MAGHEAVRGGFSTCLRRCHARCNAWKSQLWCFLPQIGLQARRGFVFPNLQAKPEREERNAEMRRIGPPARHGARQYRVDAGLDQVRRPIRERTYPDERNQWRLHATSFGSALPSDNI